MRSFVSLGILVFVLLFLSVNCQKDGHAVAESYSFSLAQQEQNMKERLNEAYLKDQARSSKPSTITFPSIFDILKHLK